MNKKKGKRWGQEEGKNHDPREGDIQKAKLLRRRGGLGGEKGRKPKVYDRYSEKGWVTSEQKTENGEKNLEGTTVRQAKTTKHRNEKR